MQSYHDLLTYVIKNGVRKNDRTNTGTISCFGLQFRHDLSKGFPILTTKKIHFKSVVHELLWFISGNTNVKYLNDNGVKIWNEWADKDGDLGPIYGHQWRAWQDGLGYNNLQIDQLLEAIHTIKTNPDCRRIIVNAWNVGRITQMALPPCHCFFQFYVAEGKLSCHMYQRSADLFLGVPFNIASYSLLTHLVADVCGLSVGELIISYGDIHIYQNHMEQIELQLSRPPQKLPELKLKHRDNIDSFVFKDIKLVGYASFDAIKAPIAV